MSKRKLNLTTDQEAFANKLFELYPDFRPTESLYLDFEGSGDGHESIISLYWPQNRGRNRYTRKIADESGALTWSVIRGEIQKLGLNSGTINWIVVHSGGKEDPQERERLIALLGKDPWPQATWVNLRWVIQKSREMSRSIRDNRNVVFKKDKKRVRRSLEALEWEFGIIRPPCIRSHSFRYADGKDGQMRILTLTKRLIKGTANAGDRSTLDAYCLKDVESMFKILRKCERGYFQVAN